MNTAEFEQFLKKSGLIINDPDGPGKYILKTANCYNEEFLYHNITSDTIQTLVTGRTGKAFILDRIHVTNADENTGTTITIYEDEYPLKPLCKHYASAGGGFEFSYNSSRSQQKPGNNIMIVCDLPANINVDIDFHFI